ncbi:MAG TPA: hypothetical protein VKX49_07325 [Bryobacteraceae bacterium]|nr:hypothetical protein [Bryobacteraceae bacterium]
MLKKALVILAAAFALASVVSADGPLPDCLLDGSCRVAPLTR